jgi:tetratricopeptide (TPR) repeat protein
MDATNGWTWYQRGRLALHAGDFGAAQSDFTKAIEDHTTVSYAHAALAEALTGLGKYQEALKIVDAYILEYPKAGAAYLVRSKIYAKMGQLTQAVSDATTALEDAKASKDADEIEDAQSFLDQLKAAH